MPSESERLEAAIARLAELIRIHAPHDGVFALGIPGVYAVRISRIEDIVNHALMRPAICLTAQGAKSVMVGDEVIEYDVARAAIYSVDVPIAAQITRASAAEPYLNLKIELEPKKIAELATRVFRHGLPRVHDGRGAYAGALDATVIDSANRLLETAKDPADAELLGPLALEELLIRMLRSPLGARLAQIGQSGSGLSRIADAVAWLASNYAEPMNVDDLAAKVNMSLSAFHRQFKLVTGMSPLQYQKALRLQEARRLMLIEQSDAASASRYVGYVSPSQFSREYARFFGSAPMKDIHRLREVERIRAPEAIG